MDSTNFVPATRGIRLANHIIDHILSMFFSVILAFLIAFLSKGDYFGDSNLVVSIFAFLFFSRFYYLLFEGIWQSTPGKWITGTKVVRRDGRKPHFGQILGRTLARIIPFEPFSYLNNPHPFGWHDRLSRTLVVSSNATKEDVQSIDYIALKKDKSNKILYIVLSIFIGIMLLSVISTVILTSLKKAEDKAYDKNVMTQVYLMVPQAQVWSPQYGGDFFQYPSNKIIEGDPYGNLFTDDNYSDKSFYPLIEKLPDNASYFYASDGILPRNGGKWFFAAKLSNGYTCIDYTGALNNVVHDTEYLNWDDVFPNTISAYSCY